MTAEVGSCCRSHGVKRHLFRRQPTANVSSQIRSRMKAVTADIHLARAIVISGGIASGKTTVARIVAARSGYIFVSFGALVQARAIEQGLPASREVLQDLGARMI